MALIRRVIKTGNSYAVVLPAHVLEAVGLQFGDSVVIDAYPGQMISLTASDRVKANSNITNRKSVEEGK